MAFKGLKRFFSIGSSKKNKNAKKRIVHNVPTPLQPISEVGLLADESGEAAQLLRSSSARYAVVHEADYASLPPLPHPINHVLQTPGGSTVSLASATTSVSSTSRGTYTVTTDSWGCASDPSVASLLDLYDEHGRLPTHTFSNSPPKERAQVQRSGSTLRQLLGNPSVNSGSDGGLEGDISWAERFLGSMYDRLPRPWGRLKQIANFPRTPLQSNADDSFISEHEFSSENPAISSLEVELSDISETPPRPSRNSPYAVQDPRTPQRASQVFDFLTEKRRSQVVEEDERSLPELPSAFSSPSSEGSPPARGRSRSHFSSDSSADSIEPPAPVPATPVEEAQFHPVDIHAEMTTRPNDVHVIMAHGPTKVIVTAPTPSYHQNNVAPSRVPRGPRSHQRQRSGRHVPTRDSFTAIPARRHVSRSSTVSIGSVSASLVERAEPTVARAQTTAEKGKTKRRSILAVFDKENNHLSAKQEVPRTPIRTGSISRPFNRGPTQRAPASPASSLELSAAGQQLMVDLRQQRTRAREQERRGRVYI
ncbi:hypothetical protein B0H16DRAFT_1532637 [Mycena metata]|uniref:Uncharacterized protein n=1 Tax=Mycena metata TaxID=1033252 RepID=A0AAD7NHT4_9AGAR|nr:hypothetical protein B0H16DRAFT_1532637 [Mycena metata]